MTQSLYELLADCTVRILSNSASGTGFFVAPGLILTCAHVIANAQQGGMQKLPVKVFWKGQEYSAQVSRDRTNALGGKAMLAKVVLREFPELEEKQRQFHLQDRRWVNALIPQQREALGTIISTDSTQPFEIFYSYVEEDEDMALKL